MTPEQQREVWEMLDRDHLAEVARSGPEPIFATISGAHLYGFASPDSDVDLRGAFMLPARAMRGLHPPAETITIEDKTTIDLDWVAHDIRKFARLMTNHNGYVLEQLFSPLVILSTPAHEELIELGKGCVTTTASRALDTKTECVIFEVAKFVGLCATANPNALEILFADERDWMFETPAWRRLHDERHRFLTKKVQQTFHGYAMAQLKKIKTHRSWLLNPPTQKPSREHFGLPASGGTLSRDDQSRLEQSIADKIRSYGIDNVDMPKPTCIAVQERLEAFYRDVLSATDEDLAQRMRAVATHALQLPPDVVAALNAEKKYRAAMKQWDSYQTWKRHRNPARAQLERKHGYDTKHAMHLIRLMRMGLEVLETGDLRVKRDDADELSAIRDGALSFDELLAAATALQESMDRAASTAKLPDDIDRDAVDALLANLLALP